MSEAALASIYGSNMPAREKSRVITWLEKARGGSLGFGSALHRRAMPHVVEGAHAVRQGGESLLTGAALAFLASELSGGLDVKGKVPIDGVIGVMGMAAGVYTAAEPDGLASDLRNVGAAAIAICTFRKTEAFLAARKGKTPAHGENYSPSPMGEDPIVAAAAML